MTFEQFNISKPLKRALQDLSYQEATPIQEQAIAKIMSGRDFVGIAQTGTGKTMAYLLPILTQLKYSEQKHPRILIVVPTRELVLQVIDEAKKLTTYMNTRITGVYGGTSINTQSDLVQEGMDILVATPGRLMDLVMCGALRLKAVQKLVVDEVDEMFNLGFRNQVTSMLEILPKRRQNLMFSATITNDVDEVVKEFFDLPEKVEIAPQGTPLEKIIQIAYHTPNFYTKVNLLSHLLNTGEEFDRVLVFVANKKLADRLFAELEHKFPEQLGVIHSNKSQNLRINTVKRFQDGTHRVMIATDLVARGLDIKDVSHVINFDTPDEPLNYIHRIGRTGRADKDGTAITFINEKEQEYQETIEELMKKSIPMDEIPAEVEISDIFSPEERPCLFDKSYLKAPKNEESQGGFHEKKEKNQKINLGGSYRRKLKEKYKKPRTRGPKK